MQTTHTPGPWNVSKHATPEHSPQFGVYAADGNDHAIIKGDSAKADAALVAAAPELLNALSAMLAHCEGTNAAFYGAGTTKALRAAFTGQKEIIRAARAAIAAATGNE